MAVGIVNVPVETNKDKIEKNSADIAELQAKLPESLGKFYADSVQPIKNDVDALQVSFPTLLATFYRDSVEPIADDVRRLGADIYEIQQAAEVIQAGPAVQPSLYKQLTYNGAEQFPTFLNYNTEKMYIVEETSQTSATEAGNYQTVFRLRAGYRWEDDSNGDCVVEWSIAKQVLAKPTLQNIALTYNGAEHAAPIDGYDPATMIREGDFAATEAGDYRTTFKLKNANSQIWSDNTTENIVIAWQVAAVVLEKPTLKTATFTYNAAAQSVEIQDVNAAYMVVDEGEDLTTEETNAGDYNTRVSLKFNSPSLTWKDGTRDAVTLPWKIEKLQLATPTTSKLSWSGSAQLPSWKNFNSTHATKTETAQTARGTYVTTFALKETDLRNVVWKDNPNNIEVPVNWTIDYLYLYTPYLSDQNKTYNGNNQSPTLNYFNATWMNKSGTETAKNVGSNYTITVSLKDTTNTRFSDGSTNNKTLTWKIDYLVLTTPYLTNNYVGYNLNNQSPTLNNFNSTWMNKSGTETAKDVGKYTITVSLKDTSNTRFADNSNSNKSLTWEIYNTVVAYPSANNVTWDGTRMKITDYLTGVDGNNVVITSNLRKSSNNTDYPHASAGNGWMESGYELCANAPGNYEITVETRNGKIFADGSKSRVVTWFIDVLSLNQMNNLFRFVCTQYGTSRGESKLSGGSTYQVYKEYPITGGTGAGYVNAQFRIWFGVLNVDAETMELYDTAPDNKAVWANTPESIMLRPEAGVKTVVRCKINPTGVCRTSDKIVMDLHLEVV